MFAIAFLFVRVLCDGFKSRRRLEAEILVLRHQLNVLQQRASPLDKDVPVSRSVQRSGSIKSHAILGSLHHHYVRV
jgi:hypothetical protein